MSVGEWVMLFAAGLLAGVINSVSSGGSFFTYPALLLTGMSPINAAATVLAALTPGNLAAIPEYVPEMRSTRHLYPRNMALILIGGVAGCALLLSTGEAAFDALVPWLILSATLLFAVSPAVRRWAERSSPSLTSGWTGDVLILITAVYLTYFGSGSGNIIFALFTIRGFGDFLSANAAKNVAMTLGAGLAGAVYGVVGLVEWVPAIPIVVGTIIGGRWGSKVARRIPVTALRAFVIAFGLFVAGWQFLA